jgi:hypothetical protein
LGVAGCGLLCCACPVVEMLHTAERSKGLRTKHLPVAPVPGAGAGACCYATSPVSYRRGAPGMHVQHTHGTWA